jgi:hypothetical protein
MVLVRAEGEAPTKALDLSMNDKSVGGVPGQRWQLVVDRRPPAAAASRSARRGAGRAIPRCIGAARLGRRS